MIGLLVVFLLLNTVILIYILLRKEVIMREILDFFISNTLESLSGDEELQKMLYQVGGIIGQGVKGGIGLSAPKTGRFKWQDLAMELAGQWVQKAIVSPSPPPAPSLSPSQDILTNKTRDKW